GRGDSYQHLPGSSGRLRYGPRTAWGDRQTKTGSPQRAIGKDSPGGIAGGIVPYRPADFRARFGTARRRGGSSSRRIACHSGSHQRGEDDAAPRLHSVARRGTLERHCFYAAIDDFSTSAHLCGKGARKNLKERVLSMKAAVLYGKEDLRIEEIESAALKRGEV